MMNEDFFSVVDQSCAHLDDAKRKAWNAFSGLNNDALHRQKEVDLLLQDLRALREVRRTLSEKPMKNSQNAISTLQSVQSTVFTHITNIIYELNIAAANAQNTMDAQGIRELKHRTESSLVDASRTLRIMFSALETIQPDEDVPEND